MPSTRPSWVSVHVASSEGRAALGLEEAEMAGTDVARFRARHREDASCLNLYQPREPTVLAPTPGFLEEGRFRFQASLAETPEEKANPWRLLERKRDADGAFTAEANGTVCVPKA